MGRESTATETASVTPSETTTAAEKDPSMQRFTATGRPMPKYEPSSLGNMVSESVPQAAQHLPFRYTDEDYINIPIPIEEDEQGPIVAEDDKKRKDSWVGKLSKKITGKKDQKFKVVRMTRGEYLAKWARDEEGNYIGTDPVPGRLTKADL